MRHKFYKIFRYDHFIAFQMIFTLQMLTSPLQYFSFLVQVDPTFFIVLNILRLNSHKCFIKFNFFLIYLGEWRNSLNKLYCISNMVFHYISNVWLFHIKRMAQEFFIWYKINQCLVYKNQFEMLKITSSILSLTLNIIQILWNLFSWTQII